MTKLAIFLCLMALSFGVVGISNATLIDRGGGLIYDDVLDVTWLQDANYAKTSGYLHAGPIGRLGWNSAMIWAENLTYYDSMRDAAWDDWRLPHALPIGGSGYNFSLSYNGSTDRGTNISAPGSAYPDSIANEMAYMYYNNLGNSAAAGRGLKTGPFINLEHFFYWTSTEHQYDDAAIYFGFWDGFQSLQRKDDNLFYMWAVRDGDVGPAPVPEPSAIVLLSTGLIELAGWVGQEEV